jgi:hypothetical protein
VTRTLDEIDAAIRRTAENLATLGSDTGDGPIIVASGRLALELVARRLLGEDHETTVALRTDREARQAEVKARIAMLTGVVLGGGTGLPS